MGGRFFGEGGGGGGGGRGRKKRPKDALRETVDLCVFLIFRVRDSDFASNWRLCSVG